MVPKLGFTQGELRTSAGGNASSAIEKLIAFMLKPVLKGQDLLTYIAIWVDRSHDFKTL